MNFNETNVINTNITNTYHTSAKLLSFYRFLCKSGPLLQYLNLIIFELYKDNIKKIYSNKYISVLKEGSGGVKDNG